MLAVIERLTHGKGFVSIYILQLKIIKLVEILIILSLYLYFVLFVLFIDISLISRHIYIQCITTG